MFQRSRDLITKWAEAPHSRRNLDTLLNSPPPSDALLRKRLEWLTDLIQWIRAKGRIKTDLNFQSGQPQALRAKYLLSVLEYNPTWKKNVAMILRSIVRDTSALDLFVNMGMHNQQGFSAEMIDRLHYKFLPRAPDYKNLASFFSQTFDKEEDYLWIEQMDKKVFQELLNLFSYEDNGELQWNSFIVDAKDAILLISTQVHGAGLSTPIRTRLLEKNFKDLPFFELPQLAKKMVESQDLHQRLVFALELERHIDLCQLAISEVYDHLSEYGVSINIVFLLDRMETQLRRIRNLMELILSHEKNPEAISQFISTLMVENVRFHKLRALFADNLSLISKKIVERSAETGEHYITRNRSEYVQSLRKAIGGGFITGFTTLIKFLIYHIHTSIFLSGFLASLNYSISFVAIQLFGFTLATKQPAMTAPSLAAKMHKVNDPKELETLVDEIIHLIRSQFIAILGNIYAVIPTMIVLSFAWLLAFHSPLITPDQAHHALQSFSILGGMAPYAAFTGVLLWFSSVIAGWMDNWFAYHRLSSAISQNRRMIFVFGESGAKRIALYFKKNISGFSGNISLAFFLGLIPAIGTFLGLPMDIRHVTLSSGALTSSLVTLGWSSFSSWEFWLAAIGIMVCGFLNVIVAFSMSMFVAIRARRIQLPQRKQIYKALMKRIKKQPFGLFYPQTTTNDGKNRH
ncbi:MAG TPA: site-specific recombinase [Pseudobdellovibrionaceae bacterium]|jgi:site-specific recombinase